MANAKNITKVIVGEDLYYLKDKQVRDSIGAANGIATLDSEGKISSSQIPAGIGDVTGVKGDSESSYRTGNVNITKGNIGLGNVGNFKAVSTVASQGLSDTEKSNARANIGAGTSSFSGSYNDLSNKPTIPAAANNGTFSVKTKVGSNSAVTAADFTANQFSADDVTFIQGSNVTLTTDTTNRTITIASTDTNTWRPVSDSVSSTSSSDAASSKAVKTAYDLAASKTSNTGTVTSVTVKMNGSTKGTVTTSGTIDLGTVITAHQDISGKADKATTLSGYGITDAYTKTEIDTLTRHTRKTDFDLSVLKQAVADQNLEKYGLKVGDQKTINGHTYVIAGLNCMKGSHSYTATTNHVGLIVIPHTTHAWNASGNTYTGADDRGAGYLNSDLHYYLKNTVLPLAQTDLGASNLITHNKLLTNAVNTTGYNRYGSTTGCSSSWTWSNEYISALSEMQVYGGTVWSSSGYDTGEADQQLEVFKHYKHTDIFEGEYPWLRDVASATVAAGASDLGRAGYAPASHALYVAGLILFH